MNKAPSANLKPKHGKKLYEPWMDYKEDLQPSTPDSTPSAPAAPADPPRYRFNSEYAESVSRTPSIASVSAKPAPPIIRTPSRTPTTRTLTRTPTRTPTAGKPTPKAASREATPTGTKQLVRRTPTPPPSYPQSTDYSKDKKLIGMIEVEFKAFYAWTTNGSEHDLTREHIESLLFPELQGKSPSLS
ncbi:hypothetical protein ANCCEY_01104 [Ancylostoma ceylanicum]|uniref:Uncharacterized protein n=2 Tax=Ancylostoma ceylanicum TaxID=53326 RepID=A0A8I3B2N8_9BILA|nr:hypothetical protein ANCCEY_01104 [Ancylostoma ceylanicum]EYB94213.1 hypothetical protein Y032_0174g462 [Ancylostoma ceylanicum]